VSVVEWNPFKEDRKRRSASSEYEWSSTDVAVVFGLFADVADEDKGREMNSNPGRRPSGA